MVELRSDVDIKTVESVFEKQRALLREAGVKQGDVTPVELIEYFSGDTPTGDTTKVSDVLSNKWLLVHELVELKELKNEGYTITASLVWDNFDDVLEAHYAATEIELELAFKYGDADWIKRRIGTVKSWLSDSDLPKHLQAICKNLIQRYGLG